MKRLDLGSSHTWHNIFALALPAMLAQLVSVLYSIVDRIYVSNIGGNEGALSLIGVGVCAPICSFITSFGFWVGLGGGPLLSISLGEKKEENAKRILATAFWLCLILSLMLMLFCYLFLKPMLLAFGASEASYPYAYRYMKWYLMGTVLGVVSLGLNQFITAMGHPVAAMITISIGCLINVGLDPLFIYVFKLGVDGAAIATVISELISLTFVIVFLLTKSKIRLAIRKPEMKIAWKIMTLGFSPWIILATDSLVLIILNTVLQRYGGSDGDFYIEIATIVLAYESLFTGPLLGISSGTQPLLGYNYGAKNIDLIKKSEKEITLFGFLFCCGAFGLSYLLATPFATLFVGSFHSGSSDQSRLISEATKYIMVYMYGIIPLAFQYVFVDGLTGLGQAKYSIWLSLFRKVFLMIPFLFLLPFWTGTAESAFYAELIADCGGGLVSTIVYLIITPKIFRKRLADTSKDILSA